MSFLNQSLIRRPTRLRAHARLRLFACEQHLVAEHFII